MLGEITLFTKTAEILEWKKKVHVFRMNYAAKKIQRQVRAKFIQPYMDIYNMMFDKVRRLRQVASKRR